MTDHAALGRGAQLHEVAELVDQVQPAAAELGRGRAVAPRQRVRDVAVVGDLDEQRAVLAPGPQHALAAGVAQRVRGQLVDGEHEVGQPIGRRGPRSRRGGRGTRARTASSPWAKRSSVGSTAGGGQRRGPRDRAHVGLAAPQLAALDDVRVVAPRRPEHVVGRAARRRRGTAASTASRAGRRGSAASRAGGTRRARPPCARARSARRCPAAARRRSPCARMKSRHAPMIRPGLRPISSMSANTTRSRSRPSASCSTRTPARGTATRTAASASMASRTSGTVPARNSSSPR